MANNIKTRVGKNTTSITNPKTKSQNTDSTSAPKKGCCSSASGKSGQFGKSNNGSSSNSGSNSGSNSSSSGMSKSGYSANSGSSSKGMNAKSGRGSSNSGSNLSSNSSSNSSSGSSSKSSKSGSMGKSGTQGGVNAILAKSSSKAKLEAAEDQCALKDMDIISDVLGSHKALIKLYGTALCESDCPKLRKLINAQMAEAGEDQFDAFSYMNKNGMYPTEQAPAPKVNKAIKQYTQKGSVFKKK